MNSLGQATSIYDINHSQLVHIAGFCNISGFLTGCDRIPIQGMKVLKVGSNLILLYLCWWNIFSSLDKPLYVTYSMFSLDYNTACESIWRISTCCSHLLQPAGPASAIFIYREIKSQTDCCHWKCWRIWYSVIHMLPVQLSYNLDTPFTVTQLLNCLFLLKFNAHYWIFSIFTFLQSFSRFINFDFRKDWVYILEFTIDGR